MQVSVDRTGKIQDKNLSSPASITCFFTPFKRRNPLESGSIGVGIALKNGSSAYVCGNDFSIEFEGCSRVKTVDLAVKILRKKKIEFKERKIVLKPHYPVGCGFGMSASLTLSALKALGVPKELIPDVAHEAEVLSSTGLGDVVTQVYGGVVCRLKASCPSRAEVKVLNILRSLDVLVLGELKTEEVLEEYDFTTGVKRLKEFLRNPTVEELFKQSKQFAVESGLADEVIDVIEAVEAKGGLASMVMLGKAVFAVNGYEAMKEFGEPFKVEVKTSSFL